MKTNRLILKVLNGEMESSEILKRLDKEGYELSYDTVCRNLKQMFEDGILNREARGGNINQNTGKRHWNYYYSKKLE